MKVQNLFLSLVAAASLSIATAPLFAANTWHAWGTHGATVSIPSPGVIEAVVNNTSGDATDYHWNKSSWSSRTGQKAFVSTPDFNGITIGSAITSLERTVDLSGSTGFANSYWNIVVEDINGKKAIVAPSAFTAVDAGYSPLAIYSIFEAEAGWIGTASTGFSSASWAEISLLSITNGPFTEFPDTLAGSATMQNDAVYDISNWAAWADQSAGLDGDWEQDGVLFVFGQSTGTAPGPMRITGVSVNGMLVTAVPEPTALVLGGLALASFVVVGRRRRS